MAIGFPVQNSQNRSFLTCDPISEQKRIRDTFNESTYEQLLKISGLKNDEINKEIEMRIRRANKLKLKIDRETQAEQKKMQSDTPITNEDMRGFNYRMILLLNKYFLTTSELENLNNVKSQ